MNDVLNEYAKRLAKEAHMPETIISPRFTLQANEETARVLFDTYKPLTDEQVMVLRDAQIILNGRGKITIGAQIARFRLDEAARAERTKAEREKRELEEKQKRELDALGGTAAAEAGWCALRMVNPSIDRTGVNGAKVEKFADLPHPKKVEYARFAKGLLDSVTSARMDRIPDNTRWTNYRHDVVLTLADGHKYTRKGQ
jgi:hypothetical protein